MVEDIADRLRRIDAGSDDDWSLDRATAWRNAAIRTAVELMARQAATKRGLTLPPDVLSDSSGMDFRDFRVSDRLDRWMVEHGGPDPLGSAYEWLLATEPVRKEDGTLGLSVGRGGRNRAGAFYTPPALIDFMLDRALEPVLDRIFGDQTVPSNPETGADIRILDPAAGCGRFLVAAARRIANRLDAATGAAPGSRGSVLPHVLRRAVFGIELDATAAEICRVNLWLEAANPEWHPELFGRNVRVGNALLGATADRVAAGLPDEAFFAGPRDDSKHVVELRRRNRRERRQRTGRPLPPLSTEALDAWCAAFLWDRTPGHGPPCPTTASLLDTSDSPIPPTVAQREIARLARSHSFLHIEQAFPEVFARGGFDVVIGNPPFLSPLASETTRTRGVAALLRCLSDGTIRGYSDTAAAFLERSTRWLAPGGKSALVQPQSFLSARDAAGVRVAALRRCSLTDLWVAKERMFQGASVQVCVPVLERGRSLGSEVVRHEGLAIVRRESIRVDLRELAASGDWTELASSALDVPRIRVSAEARLGELAFATADFRDQYYGLQGFLVEDAALAAADRIAARFPKLLTAGLIDLAENRWGSLPTRVHKRRWMAPRVDVSRLRHEGTLGSWIESRLVPKVLVATQTRVLEAFVDESGELLPVTPVLSVTPRRYDDLWLIAAALASPVASVLARCANAGSALTADAIKVSASYVLRLPLPRDRVLWRRASEVLAAAHRKQPADGRCAALDEFGMLMAGAYGLAAHDADAVRCWWNGRRRSVRDLARVAPRNVGADPKPSGR